jgi:hypothetical protein
MEKLNDAHSKLKKRALKIMQALKGITNFEGNELEKNKNYFNELNNFLDIFINEADTINLKNDLVSMAKYLQFIRNNKLRHKLFAVYEAILKEESVKNT